MANSPAAPSPEAIRCALAAARNSEDGQIDPRVNSILEVAINELWRKLQAQPEYILNGGEFSLFNYFRDRYRLSTTAQQAVERFWNNFQGTPRDIEGYVPCDSQ